MKKYQDWAKREHSGRQTMIILVLAGVLFVLIIPYLLYRSSTAVDQWLNLPKFDAGVVNQVLGLLLIVGGYSLALWTIQVQLTIGSGTPVPVVPTKKLVVKGPFVYCRNPMTLGTILAYGGIGVFFGSLSTIVIVLLLAIALISYLKFIEEKELEARFGTEYLEYKRNTPFMVPRLRLRK
jgi:protein-S-isoprenylcysteine O-methyltransferase Ste14